MDTSRFVLLVDEEPDASRVADALRREGFSVRVAGDSAEALSLIPTLRPGVILADHDLPEESGDGLARRVRALDPPASRTPFLLLCNPKNARSRVSKPAYGADICRFKPLTFPQIVGEVRRLVEMAPRLSAMRIALPAMSPTQASFQAPLAQANVVGALTLLEVESRSGKLEVRDTGRHVVLHLAAGTVFGASINAQPTAPDLAVRQAVGIDGGQIAFSAMPIEPPLDAAPIAKVLVGLDIPLPTVAERRGEPPRPPKLRRYRSTRAMPAASMPPLPSASTPPASAEGLGASENGAAPSPIDIADTLLLVAARARLDCSVEITPNGRSVDVQLSQPHGPIALLGLAAPVGRAVVARLLVLAGLDLASTVDQIGRVRLRFGDDNADVAVMSRATTAGALVELKRLTRVSLSGAGGEARSLGAPGATDAEQIAAQGTYRVVRELGSGAMGVVYLARHTFLERDVAIKLLRREFASQPEISSRFVTEARAAARARHPGLVDVSDFGLLPDGRAFLVMEVVSGETLEDALGEQGPMPFARVVDFGTQIAVALHAAHTMGVVHRDLKPSNVLVGPDDLVKVGDFGVAKLRDTEPGVPAHTLAGVVVGTPQYMSPEQISGYAIDHRTDIYALGCVLYELVSGRCVFENESPMKILSAHLLSPPPPLTSPHGPVPEPIRRTIARALVKDRNERYFTMQELAAELNGGAA